MVNVDITQRVLRNVFRGDNRKRKAGSIIHRKSTITRYLDLGIGYPWVGQSTAESDPTITSLNSMVLLRIFVRTVPLGSRKHT